MSLSSPTAHQMCHPLRRRVFLPFDIRKCTHTLGTSTVTQYEAVVVTKQPKLRKSDCTPQGNLPSYLSLGLFPTIETARAVCLEYRIPKWSGNQELKHNKPAKPGKERKSDVQACVICCHSFAVFYPGHHCRNCGYLVCNSCSEKLWPSTMLPFTFVGGYQSARDDQKLVRVCHCCHYLMLLFVTALRNGDLVSAKALYNTGNINVHRPLSVFTLHDYPVHIAARSGNPMLLHWLLRELQAPLRRNRQLDPTLVRCGDFSFIKKYYSKHPTEDEHLPLRNSLGETVFTVAAKFTQIGAMKYLIDHHQCAVTEINNPQVLQRVLHILLRVRQHVK